MSTPDAPSRITALRPTQRDPHRATIKVDGRAVGTMSMKLIGDLGLEIGTPWSDALATQVAEAVIYDKAFRAATRRLARRAMSSGMVRQKLRELDRKNDHPTPPEVVDKVMERLEELDLIDDEAFGRALIRETTRAKPAGPMLLRQKLTQKGLDRGLVDRLVNVATADSEQQSESATEFARKKLRSMARLDEAAKKRRLYGQLARRGFTPDAIRAALDTVLREDIDGESF